MPAHPEAEELGARFRALHESGCFVMPNPWDPGSAKALQGLGFEALATTSAGFAYSRGKADGAVTLAELCDHVGELTAAVSVPVSVDLENGLGPRPEDAAAAIIAAAERGAVGGSLEDFDGERLYGLEEAVERVQAGVEAARSLPFPFTVTARAENFFRGNPDLGDTIERLRAFADAGADVVYAPGIRDTGMLAELCGAVPRPVNALCWPGVELAELEECGVRRVSLGSWLAWTALDGMVAAARGIRESGTFAELRRPPGELGEWLAR